MPRYAALLRGVMPYNCRMAELKAVFEAAGFADVRTVIASGNVLFTTRATNEAAIQNKAEAAMQRRLGRTFLTFIRPLDDLRALLASDPWNDFRLPARAKRNVTFLRSEPEGLKPVRQAGCGILAVRGREVLSYYVPGTPAAGPDFMAMIEQATGKEQTTRTWETVQKLARLVLPS